MTARRYADVVASAKELGEQVAPHAARHDRNGSFVDEALGGALAAVGDDPEPSPEGVAAVMAAKREIALGGVEVCDLALEIAGGSGFFRTSPLERAYRDMRAAKYHPFTPEETLLHAGRVRLGLAVDAR